MANRNNGIKSVAKPEFTDYTVVGTTEGRGNATLLAIHYKRQQQIIAASRAIRLDNRFWDTRQKPHPIKVRAGFPTKRERDEDTPSHRAWPHSNFLKQFKIVDRITYVAGDFVHSAKVWVLHATRGWKVYA